MDKALANEAINALNGKLNRCPNCGQNQWSVLEIVSTSPFSPERGITIGGPTIPLLLVACKNCFQVSQFSAIGLGLLGAKDG